MFTAYLYKTTDVEDACKQFLSDNFKESYVEEIVDGLNCSEFVRECLLKKECLDGEVVTEDEHIAIVITKGLDTFDINDANPAKTYPLQK